MSLRDQIKSQSAAQVKRERITLPATGLEVQVRGLMLGEVQRVSEQKGFKGTATTIALAVEDPATGECVWNPNRIQDHEEIAALPLPDSEMIINTINRLSGVGTVGKDRSAESGSSPSPSPSSSDEA